MKTSKPFSTISYNSEAFLEYKLNELLRKRVLEFWAFIHHLPEADEKKPHKHVYFVPNGRCDTDQVKDELLEVDPSKPGEPLGCIRFKSSHFADWYLYALHDVAYLAMKGQARKYHYTQDEIRRSDTDYLLEEVHEIDYSKLNRFSTIRDAVDRGEDFVEFLASGQVPIPQVAQYEKTWNLLQYRKTCQTVRDGREGHEEGGE